MKKREKLVRYILYRIKGIGLIVLISFCMVSDAGAAWLSGWAKRIEITVSNTNIDSNLTHFPLMLKLGTSVGTGNDDVSAVFDELTSDANRKKIAVTKSDGTTQVYVEIQEWDDASETAYLWVSKSDLTLSSSGTTTLYLYYDSSHADNTTYVGDKGSTPAETVWDSSFVMVQHMNDSSAPIVDSTDGSHNSDETDGSPTYGATGKIGDCISYDGASSHSIPDHSDLDLTTGFTIQAWVKTNDTGDYPSVVSKGGPAESETWIMFIWSGTGNPNGVRYGMTIRHTNGGQSNRVSNTVATGNTWKLFSARFNGSTLQMWLNGVQDGSVS